MFGWMSANTGMTKRMTEQTGAHDGGATGVMTGLSANINVATAMGWRPVAAIAAGDRVMTFDAGLQKVTKVTHTRLWNGEAPCPRRFWPLEVPVGLLGNREPIQVLPHQSILVESDAAELRYGDPFTLMRADTLEGFARIARVPPPADAEVVLLHFDDDQVVFTDNGALFFCPSSRDLLDSAAVSGPAPIYSVLPGDQARALAGEIAAAVSCGCAGQGNRAPAMV